MICASSKQKSVVSSPWSRLCAAPTSQAVVRGNALQRFPARRSRAKAGHRSLSQRERAGAFTLIELLVVIGIIAILMVLIVPAFTTIKSGTDVSSAAYTTKGVLDTARTYAKANNTYTWVGFFEEDASSSSTNPATAGNGRIVISTVASNDGTTIYTDPPASSVTLNPAALVQVGKLIKIESSHLKTFADGSASGDAFDTRPLVGSDPRPDLNARIGDTTPMNPPPSPFQSSQFQYPVGSSSPPAQYTFTKVIQFSPAGEARIANNSYSLKTVAEVGIQPAHGTTPDDNSTNVAAVQLSGVGGNVKIYRK